ncbi:hypothetical protein FYK55_01630 [Roseiconus nitratireducens]|uniref:Uncharacterized protein n=1 Tax=Roseiconus nitratireducens TaxID=2605748 RepID=A0A5M6DLL2_9BACT|nr:hypothetical protein [Roseiconus nitratireducens]KAA5547142.1 hypothetical protein FYK55_01630 [Roseiconus nitratireducens]
MARCCHHRSSWQCLAWVVFAACSARAVAEPPASLPPVASVDAETRAKWLIDGTVVDAETGAAIESFRITPGTLSSDEDGKIRIRWRDNLERVMSAGRLQWPRTSGFSVMRFRISADGYRPAVSHQISRGGPHVRMRVRLLAEQVDGGDSVDRDVP